MSDAYAVLEDHLQKGRFDPAEAMARHLLEQDPTDSTAHVAYARISAARNAIDDGITRLERLLAQNQKQPEALAWLAVFWGKKGDNDRALLLARRAVALGARVADADVMIGNDALDRGDFGEAHSFYQRAVQASPKNAGAWHGRGRAFLKQGELADAEECLARAVELAPLLVLAWVDLVSVELDGGADEAAEENLAMALRAHPGHPQLLALRQLAEHKKRNSSDPVGAGLIEVRRYILGGDVNGALFTLDKLIDQYPGDERYTIVEAEIAAVSGHGDVPQLVNGLNRMVRERPTAWEARAALGRLLLRTGPMQNLRAGMAHCEEAWKVSGEHPRAGLFLFEAYAVIGKKTHAVALGQKLQEGDGPEAAVVRALLREA